MLQNKRPSDHQALLVELVGLWPLAQGSVTEVRKPCIRPHGPACKAGRKHKAILFSCSQGGKRRCRYVPPELAPVLRQALANGRRLEQRLVELGPALIDAYRRQRDAKAP